MKQIKPEEIESPEEQERRSRTGLQPKPLVLCALVVAVIVLFVPAGGPWMSQEGFISAMGRLLSHNLIMNLIGHFLLCLVYGWIVGFWIYGLGTGSGILLGALISLPLYGLNYLIFAALLRYSSNELHVFLAHLVFCLFFSAAYKAASVPRPRLKRTGQPLASR